MIPARYILAILGSIAMAIVYGLKVNLSVAMVAMVNHTALWQTVQNNTEIKPKPEEVKIKMHSIIKSQRLLAV